jgi:hypothetical protein
MEKPMIPPRVDDASSSLETLTRHAGIAQRRRPRFGIECQPGRCPICNRVMVLYMSVRGPAYHCGCDQRNGKNGNGTSPKASRGA